MAKKGKNNEKNKRKVKYHKIVVLGLSLSLVLGGLGVKNQTKVTHVETNDSSKMVQQTTSQNREDTQFDPPKNTEKFASPYKDPPPSISAKAYTIVNLSTGQKMFSVNPDLSLPPASVTKIMTALIALEKYNLDKPVVVPEKCTKLDASKVGFVANDVLTLEDILYGLLVRSGADSACAIANITDESDFIERMNRKANELGMENTNFANEIGFDQKNKHFSSVNDLAKLSLEALKYDTFKKIVGTREVTLTSLNSDRTYRIKNTNELLFTIPGTVGIKTGYTEEAGECLAYLYQNRNEKIFIVILGSNDRFGDTKTLLTWAKKQIELTPHE